MIKLIKTLFVLFMVLVAPILVSAQIADSSHNLWKIEANYSLQMPGGDIADRYGISNTIGAGATYKTKSNWTVGFEANYLFGAHLKDGSSILDNLKTESGEIINRFGEYATIALSQRGMYAGLKFGRVLNIGGPNPNSGIVFNIGGGWLHHHIRIENKDNNAPAVLGDYKKGYDRLTGGFALREFIGYQYLGNNETVNFYFGLEFHQAWTKSLRAYNFDTMERDLGEYNDFLYSFRVGWVFIIYDKQPDRFYYF